MDGQRFDLLPNRIALGLAALFGGTGLLLATGASVLLRSLLFGVSPFIRQMG